MRKYHCGGTDRSIDTLQVESKQEKIQKKQKHICKKNWYRQSQSNLHFGPSRDQHWSDASLVHNK